MLHVHYLTSRQIYGYINNIFLSPSKYLNKQSFQMNYPIQKGKDG